MTRLTQVQCALYVPRAELEAWFDRARAGERHVYARGPVLNGRHDTCVLVNEWRATGEAMLVQQRDPVTRELSYLVQRLRPLPDDVAPRRVKIDDDFRETAEGRIFLALVRAANFGDPCPTNGQLADLAGLPDADAARYVLYRKLAGRVEVMQNPLGGRRVKILETGRMTAEAAGARV